MAKLTIIYDDDFSVATYERELRTEGLEEMFEVYLEANQSFTFVNDVTVEIHNPIFESTVLEWTSDDGVTVKDSRKLKSPEDVPEAYQPLYNLLEKS